VRARVEHVFGQQQNSMGGKIVRTISIVRARFKIGMMNLADAGQASKRSPIGGSPRHERCNRSLS
jgi:hypothetical protein